MFLRYIITAFIGLITWNSFALDVPVDNKQFIYGLGTDVTYGQAQKSAMADIVMKLSTRITAKSQITQTKENNQTQTPTFQNGMGKMHEPLSVTPLLGPFPTRERFRLR